MSYRYGPALLATAYHFGSAGLGLLPAALAGAGQHGVGYLLPSADLPADAAKEFRGPVTRWPALGQLTVWEDGSFEYAGSPDYFDWALEVDGQRSAENIGYGPGISRVNLATAAGATLSGALLCEDMAAGGQFSSQPVAPLPGSMSGVVTFEDATPTGAISNQAAVPPALFSGAVTLDSMAAYGGFGVAPPSIFSGAVVLDELATDGSAIAGQIPGSTVPPGINRRRRPTIINLNAQRIE